MCGDFREVKRCTLTRGGQEFVINTSEWKKSGPGNNLILHHFEENGVIVYYVGIVENMIACDHYGSYRLVAKLNLIEVETIDISCVELDGGIFTTTLSNLWVEKKINGKTDIRFCPVWEIPHKTMVCHHKDM